MVSSGDARVEAEKLTGNEKPEKSNRKAVAAAEAKENKNKKKKKKNSKSNGNSNTNGNNEETVKPRALVEELKLFQNNQLLNQQDPMERLQIQLSELVENESFHPRHNKLAANENETAASPKPPPDDNQRIIHPLNAIQQQPLPLDDNVSTVKKGLLWQQQNYEKFHQRLFSRWKKRYFILTTDYLVCFKRTSSKVGRSEMGKFLYKTSLSDVTKIEWLKPKKSDKGAIILHIKGSFNLLLWSKENLEEWMFMISESIERNRIRRSCIMQNGSSTTNSASISKETKDQDQSLKQEEAIGVEEDFYENTKVPAQVEKPTNFHPTPLELNNNIIMPLKPTNWMIENDSSIGSKSPRSDRASRSQTITKYRHEMGEGDVTACEEQSPAARSQRKLADVREREENFKETQGVSPRALKAVSGRRDRRIGKALDEPSSRQEAIEHELNTKSKSSRESTTDRKSSGGQEADLGYFSAQVKGVINEASSHRTGSELAPDNNNNNSKAKLEATESSGRSDLVKVQQRIGKTCNNNSPTSGQVMVSNGGHNDEEQRLADNTNYQRPQVNLIRRDDSWQSLVSLTRVGQSRPNTASALQVAQRSLYAQHIMPNSVSGDADHALARHRMLSIESTITPSRGPLMRQLSVQQTSSAASNFSSERAKHLGAPIKSLGSTALVGLNQQQQRQLPNLESGNLLQHQATPTYTQQKLLQLQLLHNSNHVDYIRSGGGGDYSTGSIYGVSTRGESGAASGVYGYSSMRSNLKSAASEFSFIRPSPSHHNQALLANNNNNRAALVSPMQLQLQPQPQAPIEQTMAEQLPPVAQQILAANQLQCAPLRELPLKPSKRRQPAELESSAKGNSLGASIACFFRRAFSRRSKRRKQRNQAKLAESCSSSLGAFEANEGMIQVAPSAFSTGSKSVDGRRQQQLELSNGLRAKDILANEPMQLRPMIASPSLQQQQQHHHQQQLGPTLISSSGSPLHKSNSISATMGLTGLLDSHSNGRLLYDNAQLLSNNNNNSHLRSPFLSRSNRLSANAFNSPAHQRLLSGGRPGELPRPSSIYGQPSMTGSTVGLNSGSNNAQVNPFGQHRNSLHNHQFRAAAGQVNHQPQQQQLELRRQLDTTREVAEEGAWSPPDASSPKDPLPPRTKQQHPRRAVVSPMLQSPTMSAIYDNHPMMEQPTSYSHYDNNQLNSSSLHQFAPNWRELDERKLLKHQPTPSRQNRPAAMVAPCTPGGHNLMEHARQSPLLSRRQPQSPLVSHSANSSQRAVVNIAGAPGINLEPALAASLLRGTNIDATYQSASSVKAYAEYDNNSSPSSKAFVVATRLSKSMNHSVASNNKQVSPNPTGLSNYTTISTSSSSVRRTKHGSNNKNNNYSNNNLQSSREEELSSTTGSHASSSSECNRSKAPTALPRSSPSQDDQHSLGERSSSSTEQPGSRKHSQHSPQHRISNNRVKNRRQQRRDHSSSSSTTTNDELNSSTSQSIGTLEKPDERNWITSKLVN